MSTENDARFGFMRPLLPRGVWKEAMHRINPRFVLPGVWYREDVPRKWIVDLEALQAGPLEVTKWSGVLHLPDAFAFDRLQDTGAKDLHPKMSSYGPYNDFYGVAIDQDTEGILSEEARILEAEHRKKTRNILGKVPISARREVVGNLNQACRTDGVYLGPLCVMSTAERPDIT